MVPAGRSDAALSSLKSSWVAAAATAAKSRTSASTPTDERAAPAHVADLEREPLARRRLEDVGHRGHAGERERARRAAARVDRGLGLAEGRDELLDASA